MKKILGLFVLLLLVFSTSVSFASDGPETTKDSVIHVGETLEVSVVGNDVKADVSLLENVSPIVECSTKVYITDGVNLYMDRVEVFDPGTILFANRHTDIRYKTKYDHGLILLHKNKGLIFTHKRNMPDKDKFVPMLC